MPSPAPPRARYNDTLSPEESEALLSFLTVPYLQIPLVLGFFGTADRALYLFNPELQQLLRAVLFEPRARSFRTQARASEQAEAFAFAEAFEERNGLPGVGFSRIPPFQRAFLAS